MAYVGSAYVKGLERPYRVSYTVLYRGYKAYIGFLRGYKGCEGLLTKAVGILCCTEGGGNMDSLKPHDPPVRVGQI